MCIRDSPNLRLDFDGLIDLNGRTPRYDFRLDLERADLASPVTAWWTSLTNSSAAAERYC